MKLHLIACQVFKREAWLASARSPHDLSAELLPYHLHSKGGEPMRLEIQKAVDRAPAEAGAVLLAYGLCNNGVVGLQARDKPLVIFRAHDCIACLLGSDGRYQEEFGRVPGTYWLSVGWIEGCADFSEYMGARPEEPPADHPAWLELLEKYGEDNARYLWEVQRQQLVHYERMAYIDTGLGPQEEMAAEARRRAGALGLRFERMAGDGRWMEALCAGDWDGKRFLVVPPGRAVAARHDGSILGLA